MRDAKQEARLGLTGEPTMVKGLARAATRVRSFGREPSLSAVEAVYTGASVGAAAQRSRATTRAACQSACLCGYSVVIGLT